jgi:hypothetical protein
MTSHLHWASPNFRITARIDFRQQVHVVAAGDFSGAGSAVLRGALARIARLPAQVRLDASGVTALSADAAQALAGRTTDPLRPLLIDAISAAAAPALDAARRTVIGANPPRPGPLPAQLPRLRHRKRPDLPAA